MSLSGPDTTSSTREETIAARAAAFGSWITGFTIHSVTFEGEYRPENDDRLLLFVDALRKRPGRPANILECGCLEGGHTLELARQFPDATIHAVDVRQENLNETAFVVGLANCHNVRLIQDDFDAPQATFEGHYDAVFCVRLLYHLANPREFLERVCRASSFLRLWTVYCAEEEIAISKQSFRGRVYNESTEHPLSAARSVSFLPSLGSLIEFLWDAGYTDVRLIRKEMTKNGNGPAILLRASR